MADIVIVTLTKKWPDAESYTQQYEEIGGGLAPVVDHITESYTRTGKILDRLFTADPETLTRTVRTIFSDDNARKEYTADPVVAERTLVMKQYAKSKGVTAKWICCEMDGGKTVRQWEGDWLEGVE
jgi:hypothetical protein